MNARIARQIGAGAWVLTDFWLVPSKAAPPSVPLPRGEGWGQ
jgi:hypothetical protein